MKPGRVIALVVGCLVLVPGIGLLLGGGGLGVAYAFGRDADGYFDASLDRMQTSTVALTAEDLRLDADPGSADRALDALDADVRLRATNVESGAAVFVGIAPQADVDAYLAGVAHDEVDGVEDRRATLLRREGGEEIASPTEQDFWVARASGIGTQEVTWEATGGRWAAVVMNADGSPGVAADIDVGARAGFVVPLAVTLLGLGLVLTVGAVALIVTGASGLTRGAERSTTRPEGDGGGAVAAPGASPVTLEARLDPDLSRWLWLVKWFLALPHLVILAFLWIAFAVVTMVAGISILFTGTYPRSLFDFNVGVLRWSWRVSHYATSGGLGTDRYPPFSLRAGFDDPARLDVVYPDHLSRLRVLVKWLLVLPHLLVVGILLGSSGWASGDTVGVGGGLVGLLVLIAGVTLLVRDRYPTSLFDLIVGLNRWVYRVVAYAALMTDAYPPFRLDQGGSEPPTPKEGPPPEGSGGVDLRAMGGPTAASDPSGPMPPSDESPAGPPGVRSGRQV